MLPCTMLMVVSQLLQDLYGFRFRSQQLDVPPFAGFHIILAGHFLQLPPAGAANLMKASLAASQVDMESYMGSGLLFRRFQRFSLSIPQRSSNDVSLSRFLALCENPSRNNRPFSGGILRPTCPNCEIPANESRAWLPSQRQFAQRRAITPLLPAAETTTTFAQRIVLIAASISRY